MEAVSTAAQQKVLQAQAEMEHVRARAKQTELEARLTVARAEGRAEGMRAAMSGVMGIWREVHGNSGRRRRGVVDLTVEIALPMTIDLTGCSVPVVIID